MVDTYTRMVVTFGKLQDTTGLGQVRGQTTWPTHDKFDAGTIRSCKAPVEQRRTQQKQSERRIRNDEQNIWKDREECKKKRDAEYEVQISGESEQSRTKKHQRKAADWEESIGERAVESRDIEN